MYSSVWHAVQVTQIYMCVHVYTGSFDCLMLCLHVILGVLFSFLSSRLAAMQLWRRKSMQWVEAPMESSLNLLSVMTLGLSSGQQSVLWKREGGWKRRAGGEGELDCKSIFSQKPLKQLQKHLVIHLNKGRVDSSCHQCCISSCLISVVSVHAWYHVQPF